MTGVGPRRIYAVDVGSTQSDSFAWIRVDPERPTRLFGSSCIELLSERLVADLSAQRSVALGFEAPLFIPVPAAASRLSKGRANEGSPCWAAPPGLTVASLRLHQAAWILRFVREHCDTAVRFEVAPSAWPPRPGAAVLFCWEAFVSGTAHSSSHLRDATTAAMAFLDHEHCLPDATAVTTEHPLSLIGAAALWSGLSVGAEALRTPTVVLRPSAPFRGSVPQTQTLDPEVVVPMARPQRENA